ncbi:MAG: pks13, partial [Myxococcaceae bacterium]|nr:pks13 [Myxococcaceae bacterium]
IEIQSWSVARLCEKLRVTADQIDVSLPFAHFGLGSAALVALSADLEARLLRRLSPSTLYEHHTIAALAAHLSSESPLQAPEASASPADEEPIAIVGIGCRVPGARGKDAFWALLRDGRDMISEIPGDRFDVESIFDAQTRKPGTTNTRWGGFLDDVATFDAPFFGISPREAVRMDPQQRLLLETTYEALEDAGLASEHIAGTRTGVFVGISLSEYGARQLGESAQVEALSGTGSALSIAANRLSYVFDLRGPSLAVDTACSSSLVAVHLACQSVRSGDSEMALAGGVNLLLDAGLFISFSNAGLMAPDGRCKTFDARANGYVRGEGVGVVVLKRLSRAVADGDRIYAIVRGSAVVQDGRSNGLMAPNPRAQQSVILDACRNAGIEPNQIGFVEAHGTGTALGDAIELKALGAVVGPNRASDQLCSVGSVKTNIGHLEAAAGIVGLIKTALSLRNNELVANLHFKEPNPDVPFTELGLRVQTRSAPWTDDGATRLAGVSAFGFGGTNAHVILESPHKSSVPRVEPVAPYFLPISAKTPEALSSLARKYRDVLRSVASPASIAAAAAVRRSHFDRRLAICGNSTEELTAALDDFLQERPNPTVFTSGRPGHAPKVVFTFSGHGSQRPGMGVELAARFPVVRSVLHRCDEVLQREFSLSLLQEMTRGDRLDETALAQPAIVAMQIALVELWRSLGVLPAAVVGHSVGEISAAYAAGAFSLEQAMRISARRGRLMQRTAGGGRMLAVNLAAADVEKSIVELGYAGRVAIAAINSPTSVVISGDREPVSGLEAAFVARDVAVQALAFDHAFHSHQMEPLRDELVDQLRGLEPTRLSIPMISTVTGAPIEGRFLHAGYWGRNVREQVAFAPAIEVLIASGHDLFVEIGAVTVLDKYVQEMLRSGSSAGASVCSLKRGRPELGSMFAAISELYARGAERDLNGLFDTAHGTAAAPFADLPAYPFLAERYWLDAARPSTPVGQATHPLLGKHIELEHAPGTHVWCGGLGGATLSYLTDHRVQGFATMPGAAFVEIALAAAVETGKNGAFALRDVEFQEFLPIPEDGTVELQTSVRVDPAGALTFKISSQGDRSFNEHARGSIVLEDESARSSHPDSFSDVRARCLERIVPAGLYAHLAERGLQYGTAFRGLRELWRGDNEALGRIELTETLCSELGAHVVHPALLDACFHVLGALSPLGGPDLVVPRSIREVRFFDFPGKDLFSHAAVRGPLEGDVRIYDRDGHLVAELLGMEFIRFGKTAETQASKLDSYKLEWRKREARPVYSAAVDDLRYILVAERGSLATMLRSRLEARGCVVVTVGLGASGADFELPGSPDAEQMSSVLRNITGKGGAKPWGVVYLSGSSGDATGGTAAEMLRESSRGAGSVIALVQALSSTGTDAARLWIVTRGAQTTAADEGVVNLAQVPLAGIAKALAFERPELRCVLVDLDATATDAACASSLAHELFEDDTENQVALRGGLRQIPRLVGYEAPRLATPARLYGNREYLVTGGLGALGLLAAEWMVARGARHLTLIGRSSPTAAAQERLDAMRRTGAQLSLATIDVADESALRAVVAALGRPIAGVVHSAGVLDDGALLDLTRERLTKVLRPKIAGAWNLRRATEGMPLDFFVLYSSAVSVVGSPGQASYIAANTFLDAMARAMRAQGVPALALNWGPWAEAGMADNTRHKKERDSSHLVKLIAPRAGIEMLERLLPTREAQVMVLPFDVRHVLQFYPEGAGLKLFAELLEGDVHVVKQGTGESRLHPRPRLSQEYIAPSDETERIVAGLWQRALGIDRVGVEDNFFELGGDSVFAGQMVSQLNRTFGTSLAIRDAFDSVTISSWSALVREHLVKKLESMSDAEVERMLAEQTAE